MCIAIALFIQLAAEPKVIAPGVISTPAEEFKATVSPDGLTLLYVLTDHQFRHMTIVESHRPSVAAEWQTPDVATFSGIWRDGDMVAGENQHESNAPTQRCSRRH